MADTVEMADTMPTEVETDTEDNDYFAEGLGVEESKQTNDDFFNLDEADTAEGTAEEKEAPEATKEVKVEAPKDDTNPEVAETYDIKFLGTTTKADKGSIDGIATALNISAQELIADIQKGMDYDYAINNTPVHKLIRQYADANDMTEADYIAFMQKNVDGLAEKIARNRIVKEHPEWDEEKVAMQLQIEGNNRAARKAAEERAAKEAEQKPYEEFVAKYPDVESFPDEVAKAIHEGQSPIVAYEAYLMEQKYNSALADKEAELAAKQAELDKLLGQAKQDIKNKKTAVGSMKDAGDGGDYDAFLEGLAL